LLDARGGRAGEAGEARGLWAGRRDGDRNGRESAWGWSAGTGAGASLRTSDPDPAAWRARQAAPADPAHTGRGLARRVGSLLPPPASAAGARGVGSGSGGHCGERSGGNLVGAARV
jgi:hypothetical protein